MLKFREGKPQRRRDLIGEKLIEVERGGTGFEVERAIAVGHGEAVVGGEIGDEFDLGDGANIVDADARAINGHGFHFLLPIGVGAGDDFFGSQVFGVFDEECGIPRELGGIVRAFVKTTLQRTYFAPDGLRVVLMCLFLVETFHTHCVAGGAFSRATHCIPSKPNACQPQRIQNIIGARTRSGIIRQYLQWNGIFCRANFSRRPNRTRSFET